MRKAKKLSNKLMAILLSASMVFAPVIQSMPVYAAEPVIEEGNADTLTDNATTDEPVSDNNDSDTPAADNGDSENQGTENGDTENPGTENGDSENPGTENGDTENPGTENGDSENSGTENGDTENPGTEDGDTENPEDPDAEDGDSEDLGDAEADESLDGVQYEILETVEVNAATLRGQRVVNVSGFSNVGGWNESIYAEISGIEPTDVVDVEYSGPTTGKLSTQKGNVDGETALDYLVRKDGTGVRIDVPGLKEGTYTLTVTLGSNTVKLEEKNIKVYPYDRSGFAHFNYTSGVGAYKDDGTIKDNAVVLYVTDENKETVTLTVGNTTVTGIGNILNSVGQDVGGGLASNGGKANSNQGIIKKLADANKPLVVRFIGTVSDSGLGHTGTFTLTSGEGQIKGLTVFDSADNGGTPGDNGHMARIKSGKDITLEGIGYDATIDGWGFHFMAESSAPSYGKSFEVRNLTFINTPEDAIGMEGVQTSKKAEQAELSASVERCWVHNNEFYCPHIGNAAESDKKEGDGSVDFKRGQYFTCSYNYFEACHKTNLVGSSDSSIQYNLTYHHNYWYMCKARGPLTRRANVHMYNNYFYGQTDYAMNTRAEAYIFSEYNLFYACKSPQAVEGGAIKSYNDSISSVIWNKGSAGTVVKDRNEYVPNNCKFIAKNIDYSKFDVEPSKFYSTYKLDTDFTELRKVLISQTGVMDKNPRLPEAVNANEYSMAVKAGVTPVQVNELPFEYSYTDSKGALKSTKVPYAFTVNGPFNIELDFAGTVGILVDEAGKRIHTGDGSLINLPEGTYMIQPENIATGDFPSLPTFKEIKIAKLNITQYSSGAHYHVWEKGALVSSNPATCTENGSNTYSYNCVGDNLDKCSEKTKTEIETIKALGHSWPSNWTVVKEATDTEEGSEERVCTRAGCGHKETRVIPKGSTGGGSTGGGTGVVTKPGDYVLTFVGKNVQNTDKFFTVGGSCSDKMGSATVNDIEYKAGLKMDSKGKVSFNCNDGATLVVVFDATKYGKKNIKIDGKSQTIPENGIIELTLEAGLHEITRDTEEVGILYVSVSNAAASVNSYKIYLDYNYEDAPDSIEFSIAEGTSYASISDLVPASFTWRNHTLEGLYTDPDCTPETKVGFPYIVSDNATLYANWEEQIGAVEKTYWVMFETNGGSPVDRVSVTDSQIYTITEKTTKAGHAFAGWYDANEGGKLVEVVDGAALDGNITLYARWNSLEEVDTSLSLDCTKELEIGDITEPKTIKGFKIHALEGGEGGTPGKESTKYYMTVHLLNMENGESTTNPRLLYTNGVLIEKNDIQGNEDGLLKSIEFTTTGAGVLNVGVAASGTLKNTDTCNIVLAKNSGSGLEVIKQYPLSNTTQSNKAFEINAAGTYYLYATGTKGVAYSSIKFTQPTYTILYQTKGGTADGTDIVTKKAGEEITLPTDCTAAGYTFNGWLIGNSDTPVKGGTYAVDPDDAEDGVITITADYTPKQYTIKYDPKNGKLENGGTSDNDVIEYVTGTVITLETPTPPEGYEFAGWKVGNSDKLYGKSYTVRAEDADPSDKITFEAVYREIPKPYTIKYEYGDGTLPAGKEDTELAYEEDVINLPVCTPPQGKQFIGWKKNGSGDPIETYTVKAADAVSDRTITFTAVYDDADVEYCDVTLNPNGGTLSEGDSATRKVKKGDTINPGKCTKKGYKFTGWSVNGEIVSLPYTVTGNVTLTAEYEEGSSHEGIAIVGLEPTYEFTGAKIIPNIAVVDYDIDDGKVLAPGVDYTVKYANNSKVTTDAKPATVTVTGKGNYAGKDTQATFKIVEPKAIETTLEDLKGAKLSKINPVDYNGEAQYPEIELTLKKGTPTKYTYDEADGVYKVKGGTAAIGAKVSLSNNINKGTATILLTGKEVKGKATSVKKTFKINAIDLSKAGNKLTVDADPATYSVKGAVPASITVKYGDTTLRNGVDYTVKYSSNKKAGKNAGKIAITGKGNYTKKYTAKTYDIDPLVWSAADTGDKNPIKAVQVYAGMKAVKVKATVVDKDGNTLKPSQYTLKVYKKNGDSDSFTEYTKSDEALKAKDVIYVEAKAKEGNTDITGTTAKAEFEVGNNIAKAKFVLNKVNGKAFTAQYTGEEIKLNPTDLTVTMKGVSGKLKAYPEVLGNNEEYAYEIVSYSNNINKGTATAVIKGINGYSGTKTVKFKIVGKEMKIGEKDLPWSEITSQFKSFVNGIFN